MGRTRDYFDAYGMDEDQFNALPDAARNAMQALKADLDAASAGCAPSLSDKGAISVRGLGRFPVSLYANQWGKLLAAADQIKRFARANLEEIQARTGRRLTAEEIASLS